MSAIEQQLSIVGIVFFLVLIAMYIEYRQAYPSSPASKDDQ